VVDHCVWCGAFWLPDCGLHLAREWMHAAAAHASPMKKPAEAGKDLRGGLEEMLHPKLPSRSRARMLALRHKSCCKGACFVSIASDVKPGVDPRGSS
jgi:hypothetical protein